MTTISGNRVRVEVVGPAARAIVLSWQLPEGTAGLRGGPVMLDVTLNGDACGAVVTCGERRVDLVTRAAAVVERDSERGLWHAGAPGVFVVTWRESAEGPEVLYARSELIERLGVPGGTYEFRGARVGN